MVETVSNDVVGVDLVVALVAVTMRVSVVIVHSLRPVRVMLMMLSVWMNTAVITLTM